MTVQRAVQSTKQSTKQTIERIKTQNGGVIQGNVVKADDNKEVKPIANTQPQNEKDLNVDSRSMLYEAADNALHNIKQSNLIPTEENYSIFLIREIDKLHATKKREILTELDKHKHSEEDFKTDLINLERDFKKSFNLFTTILNTTNELYLISQAFKKEFLLLSNEISNTKNIDNGNQFLVHLNKIDLLLSKYNKILDSTYNNIKFNFNKTIEVLNVIKNKSIFNTYFGIYNMKQWFKNINLFQKTLLINEQKEENVILLIKPMIYKQSNINEALSSAQLMYIYKVLNNIIKKSTRKFDLISIYENKIFVVYLKYTNTIESTKVIKKIDELLTNSFISIDALSTLNIKLEIRKIQFDITKSVEEQLKTPLNELI